jgi:hypothetical protein
MNEGISQTENGKRKTENYFFISYPTLIQKPRWLGLVTYSLLKKFEVIELFFFAKYGSESAAY